jgi:RHS repeat-associated protein
VNISRFYYWLLGLVFCSGLALQAQSLDSAPTSVVVGITIAAQAVGGEPDPFSSHFRLSFATLDGDKEIQCNSDNPGGGMTDWGWFRLEPGKLYTMSIDDNNIADGSELISVNAPPGFKVELDHLFRKTMAVGNDALYVTLRIVPSSSGFAGRAGTSSPIDSGKVFWEIALGYLPNGDSASTLTICDAAKGTNWNELFTPAGLSCRATSPLVVSYPDPTDGTVRQLITPEAYVDIVKASDSSYYDIKFYSRANPLSDETPRPLVFTGRNPYVVYRVAKNASSTSLKITCSYYDNNSTTAARTTETTLTRTGTYPDFVWEKEDWHTSGTTAPVKEHREWSLNTVNDSSGQALYTGRLEKISILNGSGATISYAEKQYEELPLFSWLPSIERLRRVVRGKTNPETDDYTYGDDPRLLRSKTTASGGWEAYEYYPSSTDYGTLLARKFQPYLDAPAAPPDGKATTWNNDQGVVTLYGYQGAFDRLTSTETKLKGSSVSKSTITYSDPATNPTKPQTGMVIVTATRQDFTATGASLTTVTEYYHENHADEFLRHQIHSIRRPDGTKQSFAYQKGSFDAGVFTPGSGSSVRVIMIQGVAQAVTDVTSATPLTTYDSYTYSPVYLVVNRSTMEVSIRDACARLRRTETRVWTDAGWEPVAWTDNTYDDFNNLLTAKSSSNNALYSATYVGGQKTSETDESGKVTEYTYEDAGRVKTGTVQAASKSGLGAAGKTIAISALTTTYTYDLYDATTKTVTQQETVGTGAGKLDTTHTYDLAGRLVSETHPGAGATGYSYDLTNRRKTITLPNGGTRIEDHYLDTQLVKVTGTGVVPEYYSYGDVAADGSRSITVYAGQDASSRWRKSWSDMMGRTIKTSRPGFSLSNPSQPDSETVNFYDPTTGQLVKSTGTGYAATLYRYDALGHLVRKGLDINGGGTLVLASSDRISDTDTFYEKIGSAWWLTTTNTTYPVDPLDDASGAGTSFLASTTRKRMTGFPAGRLQESQTTDADNNTTIVTVDVDRANHLATTTVTPPAGIAYPQVALALNGLPIASKVQDETGTALWSFTEYDAFCRPYIATDTRGNTTTTTYRQGTALVESITDGANVRVSWLDYYADGSKKTVIDANDVATYFSYNLRGQLLHQWGGGTAPVEYVYDTPDTPNSPTYGDRTGMHTFRAGTADSWNSTGWPTAPGTADTTTWSYDPASGLLASKTDATNHATVFTYNARGQVWTRQWARLLPYAPGTPDTPVTTTYGYDSVTGELTDVTYNDATTPAVHYTYTRLGQPRTVADTTGTRTFLYDVQNPLRSSGVDLDTTGNGLYAGRILRFLSDASTGLGAANSYDTYTPGFIKGRAVGYQLGTLDTPASDLHVQHTYSNAGRLIGVNTQALLGAARDFVYSYLPSSSLVSQVKATGSGFVLHRAYDTQRDLLTAVYDETTPSGAATRTYTRFDLVYNNLRQTRSARQTGAAFEDYYNNASVAGVYNYYIYDTRGQLQQCAMYRGTPPPPPPPGQAPSLPASTDELPARRFEFSFDSAGNRQAAGPTATAATLSAVDDTFVPNALNQYDRRSNHAVRVLGSADPASNVAVLALDGSNPSAVIKHERNFGADLIAANSTQPATGQVEVFATVPSSTPASAAVNTATRPYSIPKLSQPFQYDTDGNLTDDGVWTYIYDAENRLVQMNATPAAVAGGFPNRQLEFRYDFLGRRVVKRTLLWNATSAAWDLTAERRFLYDGWSLVAEFSVSPGSSTLTLSRSYTWGLDVAGSLGATGGVGALLQMCDHTIGRRYTYTYDGNGNVAAVVNADTGALAAVYEYAPYGEQLRCERLDLLLTNAFGYSTHYTDDETDLVYYGHRYYDPRNGRFINRDPIEEQGGLNLYGFCANNPIGRFDVLGNGPTDVQIGKDTPVTLSPFTATTTPLKDSDTDTVVVIITGPSSFEAITSSHDAMGNFKAFLASLGTSTYANKAQGTNDGEKNRQTVVRKPLIIISFWAVASGQASNGEHQLAPFYTVGGRDRFVMTPGGFAYSNISYTTLAGYSNPGALICDPIFAPGPGGMSLADTFGLQGAKIIILTGNFAAGATPVLGQVLAACIVFDKNAPIENRIIAGLGLGVSLAGTAARLSSAPAVLGTSESRLAGGSPYVINGGNADLNCANRAVALDATLAGNPASAVPGGATRMTDLAAYFNGRFYFSGNTVRALEADVAAAGDGARGIVFAQREGALGHFFNAVNDGGTIRFLDEFPNRPALLDGQGFTRFHLLKTN